MATGSTGGFPVRKPPFGPPPDGPAPRTTKLHHGLLAYNVRAVDFLDDHLSRMLSVHPGDLPGEEIALIASLADAGVAAPDNLPAGSGRA